MHNLESNFIDKIVQACFDLYNKLPKSGKPIENEWTVLSCIVMYDESSEKIDVLSLGTGSKCIGATKMSPKGDIVNDSHAEVVARRGFLLYLYENIKKCLNNQPSIFLQENTTFKLKEHITFIFYSSQLPCGDASIISKTCDNELFGDVLLSKKRKANNSEIDNKMAKFDNDDIYRTGAKCLPDSEQDPRTPGSYYHILGQVRTKPGRGERTLSVSCSDKMAKWIHLGIQGSLLSMLCGSIYIKYFIFGANVPYSVETLTRALLERNNFISKLKIKPVFQQASLPFMNIQTEENARPAAGSIVWSNTECPCFEVAVQGKKLGVTKKKATLPSSSLCISKYNIYKRFVELLSNSKELTKYILGENDIYSMSYNEMKQKAVKYGEEWINIKDNFFKCWTVKPDIWSFYINK